MKYTVEIREKKDDSLIKEYGPYDNYAQAAVEAGRFEEATHKGNYVKIIPVD